MVEPKELSIVAVRTEIDSSILKKTIDLPDANSRRAFLHPKISTIANPRGRQTPLSLT
jgi:hypothetical protein